MATDTETPRRRDAQRNREAILVAARELFAASPDVPMCEVARRAGVGQATLYRNFPDHRDLVAALLDEHLGRLERLAEQHAEDPDAFFVLLRASAESAPYLYTFSELARGDEVLGSRLERCRTRIEELLRRPLCDAKRAGHLARDVTVDDFFMVLSMVKGAVARAEQPEQRAIAAQRALTLVMGGLAPRPSE